MIAKRSLRRVLAGQWIGFGLALFVGFAAMGLLLLFLLEDSFIDDRLRDVARGVTRMEAPLPERFSLHATENAPAELRAHMAGRRIGGIREFRLSDGRYLHAIAGRTESGQDFLLAYDVSDQLRVNESLRRGWPWLLLIGAVLAVAAYVLASAFVGRISRQARELVEQIGGSADPTRLRALADQQPIAEFSALADLAAESWESRLAALERERETLAFLGHELRTPLQSARTSLELLDSDRDDAAAWRRLRRAHHRLARASQSILWLATDAIPDPDVTTDIDALLRELAVEFEPLATQRGQRIVLGELGGSPWPLPTEWVETVFANLLLNAIQHGGGGDVTVRRDGDTCEIRNPSGDGEGQAGFGLGMELVRRLLQRFGGDVRQVAADGEVRTVIRCGPPPR